VGRDAGRDGALPAGDASTVDASPAPDADAAIDATIDGPADVMTDSPGESRVDAGADAGAAVCPIGVAPLEVCGCGCCGGVTEGVVCYYPSRGETRDAIPNPMPDPSSCARQGCIIGDRYVCCADPGPDTSQATICAADTSIEDQARFAITRRDGNVCTTLELGGVASYLPITGPPGRTTVAAWRALCDGPNTPVRAIGGLGAVTAHGLTTHYDVHVVLFFDNGSGSAEAVRIDRDDVAVAPRCATGACPACGDVCALDATYYFTTAGGLMPYRDTTVLEPPASFTYVRKPEAATGSLMSCAPPFPACGGAGIDVADVMAAFADPDVQRAFVPMASGLPRSYGQINIAGDAPAFEFQRTNGDTFLIAMEDCSAPSAQCTPIPPALSRLLTLIRALNQQQLADPSCAFTRP
jgi:hypothetical protein